MSPARFQILDALSRGDEQTMVELADRLSVTKRNVTTLIDGMERSGLVVRRPHPTDRRSTLVALTEPGRDAYAKAARAHSAQLDALVDELDPAQLQAFAEALTQLTCRLSQSPKKGASPKVRNPAPLDH
ncbi:MAG: MarR family transcriptional regulator [Pseudomonadota bacterium]